MKVQATLLVLSSLTTISGVALAQTSQPNSQQENTPSQPTAMPPSEPTTMPPSEPTTTPRSQQTYTPSPQAAYPQQTSGQPMYDQPEAPPPAETQHKGVAPGFQAGVRAGFGAGAGSVYDGLRVFDGSNGFVPFTADIGARVAPELYIGAYGSYAYVLPRTNPISCPEGFDCSVNDWRVGAQVDWHFLPTNSLYPYIGVFGGYELLKNHVTGTTPVPIPGGPIVPGAVDARATDKGWEVGLALGSDVRLARILALGPFFSGSIGRYESHSGSTNVSVGGNTVASTPQPDVRPVVHELFQIGIRGTMNTL
ncbi:MAG: hypothetical protein ACXVEE_04750 [Polyangiales bacterium]